MDAVSTLALIAGLGWASGIRLYAVMFFLGVIHHAGLHVLPASLEVFAHPAVMGVSGLMFLAEFLADKVPGFDTLWDALHTFVRIPAGALLAALAAASSDPGLAVAAGLLGGVMAASSHFTKAGSRAMINLSPEPFTNWTASLSEDVLALGVVWFAIKYPLVLLAGLVLFLVAMLWLIPRLWRGIKHLLRTIRQLSGRAA